ncbi:hypothetical protein ACWCXK_00655 [Streptomyces sp. NPDC001739]
MGTSPGVVPSAGRTAAGNRVYDSESLARLQPDWLGDPQLALWCVMSWHGPCGTLAWAAVDP